MKKLFLFMAATALTITLNSCSSSDGGGATVGGTVTAKIDGVSKTFNTTVVNAEEFTEGGETWTELTVTAAIGTSTSEIITFYVDKGDVGASAIYGFYYTKDSQQYNGSVTTNVTTNNDSKKLVGNFSGTVSDGTNNYVFTEGAFNIQY